MAPVQKHKGRRKKEKGEHQETWNIELVTPQEGSEEGDYLYQGGRPRGQKEGSRNRAQLMGFYSNVWKKQEK